jgi:Glucosidase II beta subunit-like protein
VFAVAASLHCARFSRMKWRRVYWVEPIYPVVAGKQALEATHVWALGKQGKALGKQGKALGKQGKGNSADSYIQIRCRGVAGSRTGVALAAYVAYCRDWLAPSCNRTQAGFACEEVGSYMVGLRMLYAFLAAVQCGAVTLEPGIDPFAGNTQFVITIAAALPELTPSHTLSAFKDARGTDYTCMLPDDSDDGDNDGVALDEQAVLAALGGLVGTCIRKREGWWTFEVCIGEQVRQYHTVRHPPIQAGVDPAPANAATDIIAPVVLQTNGILDEEYIMGQFDPSQHNATVIPVRAAMLPERRHGARHSP